MNANQIINMIVRTVMRRVIRSGLNAGIDAVGNKMSKGKPPKSTQPDPQAADTQKRMRQTMRVTRKLGRF